MINEEKYLLLVEQDLLVVILFNIWLDKYPQYDIYNLDLLTYAGDLTKHRAIETKDNYHFIKADIADRDNNYFSF